MRWRAPAPEDAPAVLELLAARDRADIGVCEYTLERLREEWRDAEFDLATDAVVAQSRAGRILAYGVVRRPGAMAVVAPDAEGRGLGAQLLGWAERRERALGRDCHRQWVAAGNAAARELLNAAGYGLARSYWRMARGVDRGLPPGTAPAGLTLRRLDVDADAVAVHALDAASFALSPDYVPESLQAFRQEHLDAHDFDAGLSWVAASGERLAGFVLSRRWPHGVGFVDILAVHPDFQRRGIGTTLLRRAFAGYAQAGLREAQLGVASDNPRALDLYERLGMSPRYRFDVYERPAEPDLAQ